MRRHFDAEVAPNGFADRSGDRSLRLWLSVLAYKQRVGMLAGERRDNLIAEDQETIAQRRRQFIDILRSCFGFRRTEPNQHGLAAALGPVQVPVEAQRAQILHAHRRVQQNINCEGALQIDKGPWRRLAPCRIPGSVWELKQVVQQRWIVECLQQRFVLLRQAGRESPILRRRALSAATVSAGALTHSDATAISVMAMPCRYCVGLSPACLRR